MNDRDSMQFLSELDTSTEWKLPRNVQSDEGEDNSMADMSTDDVDDEIENILDCVCGMSEEGAIQDIIIIVNDADDNMIVFTDLERNDVIMGRLATAQLNWYNTQTELRKEIEEDHD